MPEQLTIVPAGAGAGKTYCIEKTLAGWIEDKVVAPGRVLAVTFTEAAASELRERLRRELMDRGHLEDALELDRAYLGTIHGLGLRLLTEHAFASGLSPENRLISEAERDLLIRSRLARSEALGPVIGDVTRFGYRANFMSGRSAEDAFRDQVIRTVDLLKGLGDRGREAAILPEAISRLKSTYGPCRGDGATQTSALRRAANDLLAKFPRSLDREEMNKSAKDAFRKDFRTLRRAAEEGSLDRDWSLWQALRDLRRSKRGTLTPEGYDEFAEAVIEAANALVGHPGPLEDACTLLTALVTGGQEIIKSYESAKREAGLIDYADMIAEAERMLRATPQILTSILSEIDCVVIDEFQDTNPVQFSLLWQLARSAPRTLIVGDTKQSIMGFQGADARLSEALEAEHPEAVDPLDQNWRSDPRIMGFVNAIGPALFPESYNPLAPTRPETGQTALEAIVLPRSWADRKQHGPDCVADRVSAILDERTEVVDKSNGMPRSVTASDIAVLCYTTAECHRTADALRRRGLRVRIQAEGWRNAPAVRAARAALALVADIDDHYAAITWLTLGPPHLSLEEALRRAVNGDLLGMPQFDPFRVLAEAAEHRPVDDILAAILAETDLRTWAAGLPEPAQALADLARLEAEAREFDRSSTELRQAAGLWGAGIQTFLGWLRAQTEREFDLHPDATGWSSDAVEVTTWHKSKGREWPITVVSGLDFKFCARPGTLSTDFDSFDDLDNVLDHAGISWFPGFAAPEHQEAYAAECAPSDERAAARALYVALTRARDRLVLALPAEPSKPKERPERLVDLLRERTGLTATKDGLHVCGTDFPTRLTIEDGDRAFPDPFAPEKRPYVLIGRPALAEPTARTPWRRTPSSLEVEHTIDLSDLETNLIGDGVQADGDQRGATERGTAWHLAFRVAAERPDLFDRISAATGLDDATTAAIGRQAAEIRNWLANQGYQRLHFELPIQKRDVDGSEVNAIIDCVAESEDRLLILDHKSGSCPDPALRFAGYLPQLDAYAALAEELYGKPVCALAINWMNEGQISVLRRQQTLDQDTSPDSIAYNF